MSEDVEKFDHVRTVILPKEGDTRERIVRQKKGETFSECTKDGHKVEHTLTCNVMMKVRETYDPGCPRYGWYITSGYLDTAEPLPSRWSRLKAWLMHPVTPTTLPTAKVVKK